MYGTTFPTTRMKHCLTMKPSLRGESHVESAQGQQQHFANVGMADKNADQYILRGTARGNARIRQKLLWNELPTESRERIPAQFRGEPLHFDHLLLDSINKKVAETGATWVPFRDVFPILQDTGEQFLSAYKNQQRVRQKEEPVHTKNNRCQCALCARNPHPLPWKRKAECGSDDDSASTVNTERLLDALPPVPTNAPPPPEIAYDSDDYFAGEGDSDDETSPSQSQLKMDREVTPSPRKVRCSK